MFSNPRRPSFPICRTIVAKGRQMYVLRKTQNLLILSFGCVNIVFFYLSVCLHTLVYFALISLVFAMSVYLCVYMVCAFVCFSQVVYATTHTFLSQRGETWKRVATSKSPARNKHASAHIEVSFRCTRPTPVSGCIDDRAHDPLNLARACVAMTNPTHIVVVVSIAGHISVTRPTHTMPRLPIVTRASGRRWNTHTFVHNDTNLFFGWFESLHTSRNARTHQHARKNCAIYK